MTPRHAVAAGLIGALLAVPSWPARAAAASSPAAPSTAGSTAGSTAASTPAPPSAAGDGPRIAAPGLAPCRIDGVEHGALCGHVLRPLDPARPDGPRIEVHVAVVPALARRKHADPVFFLAGGPGQSAIGMAPAALRLLGRVGHRRDIVFVDQRGTGRSAPLHCEPAPLPTRPLAESIDRGRQRARLAACREALQQRPHGDLRQYTTAIAVQDLDAVRRALGAARFNLVGASYGTRVALEVLRQFPQTVRRAVLDGVAPPDMALPEAMAADAQAALEAVFDACEADTGGSAGDGPRGSVGCAARHPALRARWRDLLGRLPLRADIAHPASGAIERLDITPDALLGLARAPLYVPALAAALPAAIDAATAGRFEPLVGLAAALGGSRGLLLAEGQHFSVVCAEDMPADTKASDRVSDRVSAREPAREPAPPPARGEVEAAGPGLVALYREVCADWPRGVPPAGFARIAPAPAPVLLLSGGADPATPPRHGQRVAAALGASARHVVVPQAGHGVMALPCVREAVGRFIEATDDAAALATTAGLADCAAGVPRPPAFVPLAAAPVATPVATPEPDAHAGPAGALPPPARATPSTPAPRPSGAGPRAGDTR